MHKGLKISLVIPAHNEEKLIVPTLKGVPKAIDKIYVIDDASQDSTSKVVLDLAKQDKRITLIKHPINKGPGNAIITGYKQSSKEGYDIAVVIGGDNQMDLDDLPNFLEPFVKNEADYVKGNRFIGPGSAFRVMPKQRFFGNSILSLLTKFASGYWSLFDTQDGYTAISKSAIDKVDWSKVWGGYGYPSDFLIVFNTYNLKVKDVPRRAVYLSGERQSQIKTIKYMGKMLPLFFRRFFWRLKVKYFYQQFHPLILFYLLGFIFSLVGTVMGIRLLWMAYFGEAFTNEVILATLFLIVGIQLFLFAMFFDMQANAHLQNIEK